MKASSRRAARSRAWSVQGSSSRTRAGTDRRRSAGPPPGRARARRRPAAGRRPCRRRRPAAEPPGDLGRDHPFGRGAQRLVLQRRGAPDCSNATPRRRPTGWPSTVTAPSAATRPAVPRRAGSARASGRWCAVDEPLHQPLVQVSDSWSSSTRVLLLPVSRVRQPVGAVGDIGQGAHAGQPPDRASMSRPAAPAAQLAADPVLGRRRSRSVRCSKWCAGPDVFLHRGLAEIRVWQTSHNRRRFERPWRGAGCFIGGQLAQRGLVERFFGQASARPSAGSAPASARGRAAHRSPAGLSPFAAHGIESVMLTR